MRRVLFKIHSRLLSSLPEISSSTLHLHRFQKSSDHCFLSPFLEIKTFHFKCRSIHGDDDHNKDDADDDGADDAGDHNDNHLYNKDDDVSDHNEHDDHLLRDLIILRSGDNQQQQALKTKKTMVVMTNALQWSLTMTKT